MMQLCYSEKSPFVRKVVVTAMELGIDDEIERVPTDVWSPDTDIAKYNPLKKVPALISEDGTFVDSTLICRYLNTKASGQLFPPPDDGWTRLQLYQLADGVIEGAVACVVETVRRDKALISQPLLTRNKERIRATLDVIEADHDFDAGRVDIATITLGVALGYLDFRLPDFDWRSGRPRLATFYETFSTRPAMQKTAPPS